VKNPHQDVDDGLDSFEEERERAEDLIEIPKRLHRIEKSLSKKGVNLKIEDVWGVVLMGARSANRIKNGEWTCIFDWEEGSLFLNVIEDFDRDLKFLAGDNYCVEWSDFGKSLSVRQDNPLEGL
jgi:hypothetical protein